MITDDKNEALRQWIKLEHSRLHHVEEWPESANKDAVLTAVRATLKRLEQANGAAIPCTVCVSRRANSNLLEFPCPPRSLTLATRPAA
jgi:hypothetical protein